MSNRKIFTALTLNILLNTYAFSSDPQIHVPRSTGSTYQQHCLHDMYPLNCDCEEAVEFSKDPLADENSFVGSYSDFRKFKRKVSSNSIVPETSQASPKKDWKTYFGSFDIFSTEDKTPTKAVVSEPKITVRHTLNPLQLLLIELQKTCLAEKKINQHYYIRLFKLNTGHYPGNYPESCVEEKIRGMDPHALVNALHDEYNESQEISDKNDYFLKAILAAKEFLSKH